MKSFEQFCIVVALLSASTVSNADTGTVSRQTGAFTASYTTKELLGEVAARIESVISQDEPITWEIFVPPSYRSDSPAGLLVYVSPSPSGALPRGWSRVMDEHNLIWISANKSGNRALVPRRVLLALLAISAAQQSYAVDSQRVYISGFSGGGRVASMVATDYARIFNGGIFICGVNFWQVEHPRYFEYMKSNHYVFLTGEYDQALEPTKQVFNAYRGAGIEGTKLMVIRDMGHSTPKFYDLAKAIVFLDSQDDATQ